MSKILLQTTIPPNRDDWDVSRFSLLAAELRAAGHDVVARNRARRDDDPVLSRLDELGFDQLWLMAVDVGDGLTETECAAIGRIEWFPAHPHEGLVAVNGPCTEVLAQGRRTSTGRRFNLAVLVDGERAPDGRPLGRAPAESTFHHFADYNWDTDCGAPTFVTEDPGYQIKSDPSRLAVFKDYVRNIAGWLTPDAGTQGKPARCSSSL